MIESYLEIVELENGDIVLRPANPDGEDAEPLATLRISEDTKAYLQDRYFELAKCMFHAGIDFVYTEDVVQPEMPDAHDLDQPKTIH